VDKPIAPFGTPAGGDFVYETNLALSPSAADLPAALFGLAIHIGGDGAEAQLEAVMHAALRRDEVGWDAHRTRIVVLLTHDVYHVAGDHSEASANNLDIVLDGTPPGAGEDYPSEADVGAILAAEGVRPVVVTSGSKPPYDALLGAWGFGEARAMEFDGANIATQIEIAVHAVVSP
jgi:hypothetical protein